jgi:hypothetical protein
MTKVTAISAIAEMLPTTGAATHALLELVLPAS